MVWFSVSQILCQIVSHHKVGYFFTPFQACPTEACNKKVVDQGNGMYRCEKCAREFPNYKWRMILSVRPKRIILFVKS